MSTVMAPIRTENRIKRALKTKTVKKGIVYLEYEISTPLGPRIISADKEAERITGYSQDVLVGQPFGIIYDPASLDSFISLLHGRVSETKNFCWADKFLVKKGGNKEMLRWTFSPVKNAQDEVSAFAITMEPLGNEEIKFAPLEIEMEAEIPTQEANISASIDDSRTKALELVAGGIAHDFKNILQTIKSTLEMARMTAQEGTQSYALISDAELALNDAVVLARQMQSFTKGYESDPQVTYLDEMLTHVTNISTMGTDVNYQLSISDDLSPVFVDPNQLNQVFQNIIINGCQAMPDGGLIQVSAQNTEIKSNAQGLDPGSYVVISIRDRGCGISSENIKKVFDADFTTKANGTGVGLASCKAIIQKHGGKIAVESTINAGTVFIILLPICETELLSGEIVALAPSSGSLNRVESATKPSLKRNTCFPDSASSNSVEIPKSNSPGGRVLIVDDQDRVLTVAEKLLQFLGYDTVSASCGEDALTLYREYMNTSEPIDAVLLDMTLPGGLSGNEVKQEIKKIDEDASIIATSGYFEDKHAVASFLQEGWAGVLPKPYAIDALSETINDAILRN